VLADLASRPQKEAGMLCPLIALHRTT